MSEIPDNNTQEMSTFAYALLENYEVFGKTEDEYEIGTRDKLIQYIGGLESKVAELEVENAMLKQLPQPIKFWSDEKKQIYKINERRTVKSGSKECGE